MAGFFSIIVNEEKTHMEITTNISPVDDQPASLTVIDYNIYRGPHLYSHTPMIRIQVDLGMLEERPTSSFPGFTAKLQEQLPGLWQHTCSTGKPGGFISRLEDGTWFGHVIEHVALELQSMAGMKVTRGKTRSVKGKPGCYNIMYAYHFEDAGLCAGRLAMELISSMLDAPFNHFKGMDKVSDFTMEGGFNLEAGIAELKRIAKNQKMGPTTQSLIDEAERRDIPWRRLDGQSLVQFGTGKHQKLIRASITSNTSHIAVETAGDKDLTKKLLSEAGIPVPNGHVTQHVEDVLALATRIGYPVAIKPFNGNHGRGVSTNLFASKEVLQAFARAQEHSRYVIVEKHFAGSDYRALIINGELVALAERVPAHVIGNGKSTIAELIEIVNADPRRGNGHEEVMTRIKIDDALHGWLNRSNLSLESIPALGEQVVLAATANLSTGGTAVDCTDDVHPDNAAIAKRAAQIIGLDVAGIDMVLPDITRSWRETGGGIIEVNAAPGFRMHLQPAEGRSRNVAKPVLESLFPANAKTKIPVVAITGTNGKSTTVRMTAHILRQSGLRVGFTSTSGIFVNDDCIWKGDASGPKSAKLLMRDPTIDVAVLETARGGILREGLGVSEFDVGAVLNVTADHLGISGIHTLEDLAAVKSVVTETVGRHGVSVLNADDPQTAALARHAGGALCYFSLRPAGNKALAEHIEQGGKAITREILGGKDQIVLYLEGTRIAIIAVNDIPATCMGAAGFNIENAMAAAAVAHALHIAPNIIKMALASFTSSFEQNPGRFNIYDGHGFRVIMDYAHNPAGLRAVFDMIREMRLGYNRVIGHFNTPGDRRDDDIREIGRIAGKELDIAVFRELPDNRGRPAGEVIGLLAEGAREVGCSEEKIICVYGEVEATDVCLKKAQLGDLVIVTPSDIEGTWKQILAFKPSFFAERDLHGLIEEKRFYA